MLCTMTLVGRILSLLRLPFNVRLSTSVSEYPAFGEGGRESSLVSDPVEGPVVPPGR